MPTEITDNALGGRIALIKPADLNHGQSKLYKKMQSEMVPWAKKSGFLAETEDKRMIGPFNPMLLSPEISEASLDYLDAEQKNTTLTKRMREIVILATGAAFQSAYELYAHKAVAKSVGLEPEAIEASLVGKRAAEPVAGRGGRVRAHPRAGDHPLRPIAATYTAAVKRSRSARNRRFDPSVWQSI